MMSHYYAMLHAGMEFLRLTALGLGLDEHEFDDCFVPTSVSTLRIMHYPTYKAKDTAKSTQFYFHMQGAHRWWVSDSSHNIHLSWTGNPQRKMGSG